MLIPQCLFCGHTNPADAKYCNECGSPLHLKLCKQCEAINDTAAKTCHKCGTAIAAPVIPPEAEVTPGDVGPQREHSSLSEPIAEDQVVRARRPASDATASDADIDAIACACQSSNTGRRSPLSEILDTPPTVASQRLGTTAPLRRRFSVAVAAPLSVILLSAVGVLAYYAYRHPVQLSEQVSPPSTLPHPSAIEATVETMVEPKPEPASASAGTLEWKSPKSVKSGRGRPRAAAEHVAVPPAQERAAPPAESPEPGPVPSMIARPPDPPPGLNQQLARCDHGSVFERVLCDQRVRIAYCEGRWGRVPECPSGRVADYGQ